MEQYSQDPKFLTLSPTSQARILEREAEYKVKCMLYDTMKAEFKVMRRKMEVLEVMKLTNICDMVLESVPMSILLASSSSVSALESLSRSETVPVHMLSSVQMSVPVSKQVSVTSTSDCVFVLLFLQ
jgi:hypothetical protein